MKYIKLFIIFIALCGVPALLKLYAEGKGDMPLWVQLLLIAGSLAFYIALVMLIWWIILVIRGERSISLKPDKEPERTKKWPVLEKEDIPDGFENHEGKMPEQWEQAERPDHIAVRGYSKMQECWLKLKDDCTDPDAALSEIEKWKDDCLAFEKKKGTSKYGDCNLILLSDGIKKEPGSEKKKELLGKNIHLVEVRSDDMLFDICDGTEHEFLFDWCERPPLAEPAFDNMPGDPETEKEYWYNEGKLPPQFMSCANPFMEYAEVDESGISAWLRIKEKAETEELEKTMHDLVEWKKRRAEFHRETYGGDCKPDDDIIVIIPRELGKFEVLPKALMQEMNDNSLVVGDIVSTIMYRFEYIDDYLSDDRRWIVDDSCDERTGRPTLTFEECSIYDSRFDEDNY